MNSYELSRSWFDHSFENPEIIKPIHTAIYFFAIEHCNRMGWKKKFGFPTHMVMEAIGMKSYGTYKKHFDEIVDWGFFKVHQYSKNQNSSNIIELTLNVKANDKALDKALSKHGRKQRQGTDESTDSIDKQVTLEPKNNEPKGVTAPTHPLVIWINDNCPSVAKMKDPLTDEQADRLAADLDITTKAQGDALKAVITDMDNKPDLHKKYKSANLTIRKWWANAKKWEAQNDPTKTDPSVKLTITKGVYYK